MHTHKIIYYSGLIFMLSFFCMNCQNHIEKKNKINLITVTCSECTPCDLLLHDSVYRHCTQPKVVYDITKAPANRLLGQALWNIGYPTTYFITDDNEIIGITQGLREFQQETDSILQYNKNFEDIGLEQFGVKKEVILPLLTHSYKALLAYFKKDFEQTKIEAKRSLEQGSSFFCNYLLYKVYEAKNQSDSASYYKEKALTHQSDADLFLYSDLIEELYENN